MVATTQNPISPPHRRRAAVWAEEVLAASAVVAVRAIAKTAGIRIQEPRIPRIIRILTNRKRKTVTTRLTVTAIAGADLTGPDRRRGAEGSALISRTSSGPAEVEAEVQATSKAAPDAVTGGIIRTALPAVISRLLRNLLL